MNELLEGLRKSRVSIVSVSPQSVASLAVRYQVPINVMARRIARFFKEKGATHVIDTSFARLITHKLVAQELVERIDQGGPLPLISRYTSFKLRPRSDA